MADKTVECVVLEDRVPYYVKDDRGHYTIHQHGVKGETIVLDEASYKRLRNMKPPAVGTKEELVSGVQESLTPTTPTDMVALSNMTVRDLLRYLASNPDSSDQVDEWMEALASEEADRLKDAVRGATPHPAEPQGGGAAVTDEQIRAYNVEDAVAFLNQHPDATGELLDRFEALEKERDNPRRSLLDYLEKRRQALAAQ